MLRIELEQEDDGRWIAEIPELAGVMAYGDTRDKAKAKVEASKGNYEKAVALLESAKTTVDKEAALLKVTTAKAQFDADLANLEKIADQPISTPLTGILGTIGSLIPGLPGWITTAAASAVAVGVNIARKNYRGALKEVAVGYEIVTDGLSEPERKARRQGIGTALKGTGGAKALNSVLAEAGLLNKSKPLAA